MPFRISALKAGQFSKFLHLTDTELEKSGVRRIVADTKPGFPCRISLKDADVGESVLLLNFTHHNHNTPYRASHAIFIRESACQAEPSVGEIPEVIKGRLISVRGFDDKHDMVDANVVQGNKLGNTIHDFFDNKDVSYLHLHNAKQGCYAARVDRA